MIRIDLKSDDVKRLMDLLQTEASKALYRATKQTTQLTASFAAKFIAKEYGLKYRAVLRGIKVKLPRERSPIIRGELSARSGDFIPLAGSQSKIRWISKVPKNYKEKKTLRRYPLVSVKFFGQSAYKEIPGAFRADLFGGNQKEVLKAKQGVRKAGLQLKGKRHKGLLMRRSAKRLPLRELFTNQPDIARNLIDRSGVIESYAQKTLDAKIQGELRFREIRQIKAKLR